MNFGILRKRHRYAFNPLAAKLLHSWNRNHDAYANSAPRHAIQKSLTAELVALAPLRLNDFLQRTSRRTRRGNAYLMIFCSQIRFSVDPTFWLGKSSLLSAFESHIFACGCAKISFFSGSARTSNSLRAASPPMFRTKRWHSCGPYCCVTAAANMATSSDTSKFWTKVAYIHRQTK